VVGDREPRRVGVAVDGDEPDAELLQPRQGATLVAAGADEEDPGALGRVISAAYQV
jgi:hypothetical protein